MLFVALGTREIILFLILLIFISGIIFLLQFVFGADKRNKLLKEQNEILTEIARKKINAL